MQRIKLVPRADGSFKVLEKINDNAYKLDLPAEFGASSTFNVADLKPYLGEEEEIPSRATRIQEGEDVSSSVRLMPPPPATRPEVIQGPITRARARELNYVILLRNKVQEDVSR